MEGKEVRFGASLGGLWAAVTTGTEFSFDLTSLGITGDFKVFAFIKATEGGDRFDDRFREHWRGARAAGIPRGAYHFFRANVDAKKQANKFIDYVRSMSDTAELPPVLDL